MFTTQDFLGYEIKEGDFVVYAVSHGSSPYMTLARVASIEPQDDEYAMTGGMLPRREVRMRVVRYQTWNETIGDPKRNPDGTVASWSDFHNPHKKVTLRTAERMVKVPAPGWVLGHHHNFGVPGA